VVLAADKAKALAVKPMARILGVAAAGVDPAVMGIGVVPAVRKLLGRLSLQVSDFDLVELNEAFAAQVLACDRELRFDPEKLNVNGGAIAIGHPIGATGTRISVTLLHEMARQKARLGLATLCVSGGMGMAAAYERVA
jgi:acetyl-CoA C-acetyltransferase